MSETTNSNYTILIVEDEPAIRDMVRMTLEREAYTVLDCETAEEAKKILKQGNVHLLLLDWMLPAMSGVELAKKLRDNDKYSHIPIILLTAKAEEDDKLQGFEAGVDDYISKPFSLKEMLARVHSVLRRSHPETVVKDRVSLGGLTVDKKSHLVYTDDQDEIHLGPTEFKMLLFLMSNPGRVYSRDQLLDHIWGVGVYVDERTVDVHVRRLRKALAPHNLSRLIRTVRGSGYSFKKPN